MIEWSATHKGGPKTRDCMPLSDSNLGPILLLHSLIFLLMQGPDGNMSLLESAVGVTFGKRQLYVRNLVPGQPLLLVSEPSNPHDSHAVAIHDTSNNHLGYLSRGIARVLAPFFRLHQSLPARVRSVGRSSTWGPHGFSVVFDLPEGQISNGDAKLGKRPHSRISS